MATSSTFAVDLDLLQAQLAKRPHPKGTQFIWWIPLRFVQNLFIGFTGLILLPSLIQGDIGGAFTLSGRTFWFNTIVCLAFAVWFTVVAVRAVTRPPIAAVEWARKIEAGHATMTDAGWTRRLLRRGLVLGCAAGIPLGILAGFLFPEPLPDPGGRVLVGVVIFVGTFLWLIPALFGIRWLILRSHRKLQLKGNAPGS